MVLKGTDIEPGIRQSILDQITAAAGPGRTPSPEASRAAAESRRRFMGGWKGVARWIGGCAALGAGLGIVIAATGGPTEAAFGVGFMTLYFGGILGIVRAALRVRGIANIVHPDLMEAWLPALNLSPVERAYCEALVVLSAEHTGLDEVTARDVLTRLNLLVQHSRELETRRESLARMLGSERLSELEAERDRIAGRLEAVSDAQARDSLQQSLSLCENRLSQASSVAPHIERLEAQQEVVIQTMQSVAASLARMQALPADTESPVVDEIKRSVSDVVTQVRAVEQAVQEVVSLQRG